MLYQMPSMWKKSSGRSDPVPHVAAILKFPKDCKQRRAISLKLEMKSDVSDTILLSLCCLLWLGPSNIYPL